MFQAIVINIIIWALGQEKYQQKAVKILTSIADGTNNKVDDVIVEKIIDFIGVNKRSILTVAKKEVSKNSKVVDLQFLNAISSIPQKK